MIVDGIDYMHEALINPKKRIIAEGANATMLDIDFGTFPYVTSSNTTIGGVCTGLGVPPQAIETTIGIMKAYTTRVGAGPFPTWLDDEIGDRMQKVGHEFGATTGRKRKCGWLDLNVVKYSHKINAFNSLNITKLDVLSGINTLKVATHYELDGKKLIG
jgi:adenylosuccinate synthase